MAKIILEFIKNIMFTINVFLRMFLILFFSLTISSTYFPDSIVYERREREENTAVGILSREIRIVGKYDTLPPLSLKWRISMERIHDVTLSSYTTASRDMMLSFDWSRDISLPNPAARANNTTSVGFNDRRRTVLV